MNSGTIIWRHLIPNILGPVIVYTTLTVPSIMLTEAFLSFLGLGISEPETSWGVLINEGAKILEEGLAIRASDIDVIWLHGYGFPRHLGGPMFYGDTIGLRLVCDTLDRFHREWGDKWEPSTLLRQLVDAGSSFAEWDKRQVG